MIRELCLLSNDIYQYSFSKNFPFILFPSIHLHYTYKDVILSPKSLYLLYNKEKSTTRKFVFDTKYIEIPICSKLLYNTNYTSIYNEYNRHIQSILPFYKDITNIIIEYLPISPIWKLQKRKTCIQSIPYSLYNIVLFEIPIKDFYTCKIPAYYRKSLYGIYQKDSCIPYKTSTYPIDISKYHKNDILVVIFFTNIFFNYNSISYSSSEDEDYI